MTPSSFSIFPLKVIKVKNITFYKKFPKVPTKLNNKQVHKTETKISSFKWGEYALMMSSFRF